MTVKRILRNYLIWLSVWSAATLSVYIGIILDDEVGSYLVMLYVAVPTTFSLTFEAAYKRFAFLLVTRADRKRLALLRLAVFYAHFFVYALLDLLLLIAGVEVFAFACTALGLNVFCASVCVAARAAGEGSKAFDFMRIVAVLVLIFGFFEPYLYTLLPEPDARALFLSAAIILSCGLLCAAAAGIAFYRRRNRLSYA